MIERDVARTSDAVADLIDRLRSLDERLSRTEGTMQRLDIGPMRWAVELTDPNGPDGPVYDVTLVNPVTGQAQPIPSAIGGGGTTQGSAGPPGAAGATGPTGATGGTLTVIDGGTASSTY